MKIMHCISKLALCVAFLLTGCSGGGDASGGGSGEEQAAKLLCGPCEMEMSADAEHVTVGDMEFVFCSDKCKEVVMASPQDFAEYAIQH